MNGLSIFVSVLLPIEPTPETDVVRQVRHGLADVLEWLGEEVGPKPGGKLHAIMAGTQLIVSQELADKVAAGRHADIPQTLLYPRQPPPRKGCNGAEEEIPV